MRGGSTDNGPEHWEYLDSNDLNQPHKKTPPRNKIQEDKTDSA